MQLEGDVIVCFFTTSFSCRTLHIFGIAIVVPRQRWPNTCVVRLNSITLVRPGRWSRVRFKACTRSDPNGSTSCDARNTPWRLLIRFLLAALQIRALPIWTALRAEYLPFENMARSGVVVCKGHHCFTLNGSSSLRGPRNKSIPALIPIFAFRVSRLIS